MRLHFTNYETIRNNRKDSLFITHIWIKQYPPHKLGPLVGPSGDPDFIFNDVPDA